VGKRGGHSGKTNRGPRGPAGVLGIITWSSSVFRKKQMKKTCAALRNWVVELVGRSLQKHAAERGQTVRMRRVV